MMQRLNADNWQGQALIKEYISVFSEAKNSDKNKSKIEGNVIDSVITILRENKITSAPYSVIKEPAVVQKSESVPLNQGGVNTIMLILGNLFLEGSEYMFSFYYLEVVVRTFSEKYFKIETSTQIINSINDVIMSIGNQLKKLSINMFSRYFECLFREVAQALAVQNTLLDERVIEYLDRIDVVITKLGTMKQGFVITKSLQNSISLCYQEINKRTIKVPMMLSYLKSVSLLYSIKYEEQSSNIQLVYVESGAAKIVLKDLFSLLNGLFSAKFEYSALQKEDLSEEQSLYLIKLSYIIFTQIISRGSIDHVSIIVAYMKDYKEQITDTYTSWNINAINTLYWVYSAFLFASKWEIIDLGTAISNKYEEVLSSQNGKTLLLMLRDSYYDRNELTLAVEMLKNGEVSLPWDIGVSKVMDLIQTHFQKYDGNIHDFGLPLSKIEIDSTRPDLSICKN